MAEELYQAIEQNDLATVQRWLEANPAWTPEADAEPLLHAAVNANAVEIVIWLLEHGHDPNISTRYHTPLTLAALDGNAALIRLLLERGADPNLKQPLYRAMYRGNAQAAIALIEGGADVCQPIKERGAVEIHAGWTEITDYLVWALSKNMPEVALALIEHGADVKVPDALPFAAYKGYAEVVSALLARKARSAESLYQAALQGHEEVMRRLVDVVGVNLRARYDRDWYGFRLVHLAALGGWTWLVERWLARGGAIDALDKTRQTPLRVALRQSRLECAQFLYEHGADMLAADKFGNTPLHAAAANGALALVEMWCAAGGEVNVVNAQGDTPLSESLPNHPDIALVLLAHGAKAQVKVARDNVKGFTPLHLAAQGGHLEVVQKLIERGADVEARNERGDTPLILAARGGHKEVLRFLMEHGAHNAAASLRQFLTAPPYHDAFKYFAAQGDYLEVAGALMAAMPEAERAAATRIFQAHLAQRLHWIGSGRDKDLTGLDSLVALGAPLDAANEFGFTALHYAAERGNGKCVAALLRHGAAVNVQTLFGYTPLHYAARHADVQLLTDLLNVGANPNAVLSAGRLQGWTPLHFALSYAQAEIAELLRPLSPPVGAVAPGSHALRGVYANDKDGFTPTDNTRPIVLDPQHRCLRCHEIALYRIGIIWESSGLDPDSTAYFICANCGAPHDWRFELKLYKGPIPWHRLE